MSHHNNLSETAKIKFPFQDKATGKELQPRPVGEENGIIVYNYMPISAVHYVSWVIIRFEIVILKYFENIFYFSSFPVRVLVARNTCYRLNLMHLTLMILFLSHVLR